MKFTKVQGAGNDFVIIDDRADRRSEAELSELTKKLCARRLSVGADGLMAVETAQGDADFRMLFFNADGSLGEMCGNGARCICRWGFENGLSGETQHIETTAGDIWGRRVTESNYRIRLNDPTVLLPHYNISLNEREYECAYLELGSPGLPHAIVHLPGFGDMPETELRETGQRLRYHKAFPKGANVTFWEAKGDNVFAARTFERGVEDFTLACGTGAGSLVAALTVLGISSGEDVHIKMPGGELVIDLTAGEKGISDIYLTGPTVFVATGETWD